MRYMVILTVVAGLFVVTAAQACPASYVKSIGQQNDGSQTNKIAKDTAKQKAENKGYDTNGPAWNVMKDYVVGTLKVDHNWNIHKLTSDIARNCSDSENCWHCKQHWGDAVREAGAAPQITSKIQGG